MIEKRYLGDAVYCEIERGMIKLTTWSSDHGEDIAIYLEPEVLAELKKFDKDAREVARKEEA